MPGEESIKPLSSLEPTQQPEKEPEPKPDQVTVLFYS